LSLTSDVGEVRSFFGEGNGSQQELDLEHLSSIVEVLNERFGTYLTDVDKLLLDKFEESWVADGEPSDQAQNNSIDNFRLVFVRKFLQTIITRVDANDEIYKRILDDEGLGPRSESSTCARSMSGCGNHLAGDSPAAISAARFRP
jgi:type I restriction enzyme R subunit